MAFGVSYNYALNRSMRHLDRFTRERAETMEQVSSARRTIRAKHDAAGSAVVSNLDATQRSKRQAIRNINDGLSLLSVAEGGLNEITDMVQRMRELAVQSASETLADTERTYLQNEYADLMSEVTRVARETKWGETSLLTFQRVDVGLVIDNSASMNRGIGAVKTHLSNFKTTLSDNGLDVGLALFENSVLDTKDSTVRLADNDDGNFAAALNGMRATAFGSVDPWAALMNASGVQDDPGDYEPDAMTWTKDSKARVLVSITDTRRETDKLLGSETQTSVANDLAAAGIEVHSINNTFDDSYYSTITSVTGGTIQNYGGNSAAGVGTAMNNIATRVGELFGEGSLQVQASHGSTDASRIELKMPVNATAGGLELDLTSVATSSDAQDALGKLDDALGILNSYRSRVGSYTNRLESALELETTATEAVANSQSRIEDLDMAIATAKLAKLNIMQQASMAVMGQAKGMQQSVLRLIG